MIILRRTKSLVLEELPPKTELMHKTGLSSAEMAFYETLRRKSWNYTERNVTWQITCRKAATRQVSLLFRILFTLSKVR